MKKTFTYIRVQSGSWGSTELRKTISVKADNEISAWARVNSRADAYKSLSNGDRLTWRLDPECLIRNAAEAMYINP